MANVTRRIFSSLADAKAEAKNLIKEIYTQGDSKIHLAADEKLDWQGAMNILKRAGIRSSLATICRQYADLCAAAGGAGLLTDIMRKNVSSGPAKHMPIQLGKLKDIFISTMESEGRSTRYVQVLKSYCGTFVREIGPDTMTDQITREMIQEFLNDRKVGPCGKLNFARAIRVVSVFGKRQRCVPENWSEIEHLTLPLVKDGTMLTYSPDELERLLAAAPARLFHAWPWALLRECGRQKLSALDGTISDLSQKMTRTGSLTWKLGSPKRTAGGPSRFTRRWPSGFFHTSGLINRSGLAAPAWSRWSRVCAKRRVTRSRPSCCRRPRCWSLWTRGWRRRPT
jgi:hypothetical protein